MKKILISQNIKIDNHGQLTHIIENSWYNYFSKKKIILVPVFTEKNISSFINELKPDGLILSGGNSLSKFEYNRKNKIRDEIDTKLFNECLKIKIPILAVCRGFQFIANIFGGKIENISMVL